MPGEQAPGENIPPFLGSQWAADQSFMRAQAERIKSLEQKLRLSEQAASNALNRLADELRQEKRRRRPWVRISVRVIRNVGNDDLPS